MPVAGAPVHSDQVVVPDAQAEREVAVAELAWVAIVPGLIAQDDPHVVKSPVAPHAAHRHIVVVMAQLAELVGGLGAVDPPAVMARDLRERDGAAGGYEDG